MLESSDYLHVREVAAYYCQLFASNQRMHWNDFLSFEPVHGSYVHDPAVRLACVAVKYITLRTNLIDDEDLLDYSWAEAESLIRDGWNPSIEEWINFYD